MTLQQDAECHGHRQQRRVGWPTPETTRKHDTQARPLVKSYRQSRNYHSHVEDGMMKFGFPLPAGQLLYEIIEKFRS